MGERKDMRIEWFGIAEASARDARGAMTLVGVDQNIIVAPTLPMTVPRSFVLLIDDEGETPPVGTGGTLEFMAEAPSGRPVLAIGAQRLQVGEKQWPNLPGGIKLGFEVPLSVNEYGTHKMRVRVTFDDGTTLEQEKSVYVVPDDGRLAEAEASAAEVVAQG